MAGFDASAVVEPLEYDFSKIAYSDSKTGTGPVVIPALVGVKGVIPEPSDSVMARYMDDLKALVDKARSQLPTNIDTTNIPAVIEAIDTLETDNYVDLQEEMAGIYSRLTGGQLTKEQILAVPPRIRQVFYSWLRKETQDPEVVTDAGKRLANGQLRAVVG